MNSSASRYEGWLYGLAFLLALGLRLLQLGAAPLNDMEAGSALQALHVAEGLRPAIGPHPAYVLFTSVLFYIFGSTNFLARLVPALAGTALSLVPLLFRDQLKPRPALILALILAVEPGMLALSRQAASPILAITFLLLAIGFFLRARPVGTGAFAAMAMLSGPSVWEGVLGLVLAGAAWQALTGARRLEPAGAPDETESAGVDALRTWSLRWTSEVIRMAAASFGATLLLAGTLFFLVPNGLSAAAAALPEYVRGWGSASTVPSGRLLLSLLVYQPLALGLSLLALARALLSGGRRVWFLAIWFAFALLLALLLPSRQFSNLGWCLLPLWSLAALELTRRTRVPRANRLEVSGVALLVVLILAFVWFDFAGLALTPIPSADASIRLGLMVGSLALLALTLFLVAAGWSTRSATFGSIWGLTAAFGIYTIAGGLGAAGLRAGSSAELWWPPDQPAQVELLESTVSDLSNWSTGNDLGLPVLIFDVDSPALEWALRMHRPTLTQALDLTGSPPIVITPLQADVSLSAAYRGQDFGWRQNALWETAGLQSWITWIALRRMPTGGEQIILWARDDLFLDARPSLSVQ